MRKLPTPSLHYSAALSLQTLQEIHLYDIAWASDSLDTGHSNVELCTESLSGDARLLASLCLHAATLALASRQRPKAVYGRRFWIRLTFEFTGLSSHRSGAVMVSMFQSWPYGSWASGYRGFKTTAPAETASKDHTVGMRPSILERAGLAAP